MNKQEAIEKLQGMKQLVEEGDKGSYERGFINALTYALNVTKKLEEPEKTVVPQFVADWYENNKNDIENSIYKLCIDFYLETLDKKLQDWFGDSKNKPIETIRNMKFYGYEVEKEKLFTVKFSNEDFGKIYIGIMRTANKLGFSTLPMNDKNSKCYFTESELKELKFWDNPAFETNEVK